MSTDLVADIVAGYAALVATGAAGWQVFQWQQQRVGALSVTVDYRSFARNLNPAKFLDDAKYVTPSGISWPVSTAADPMWYFVVGKLVNENEFPLRCTELLVSIQPPKRIGVANPLQAVTLSPEQAGIPEGIEPHTGVEFAIEFRPPEDTDALANRRLEICVLAIVSTGRRWSGSCDLPPEARSLPTQPDDSAAVTS